MTVSGVLIFVEDDKQQYLKLDSENLFLVKVNYTIK